MYGKGFLGNLTENLQADCVQSCQAGFMQCFLELQPKLTGQKFPQLIFPVCQHHGKFRRTEFRQHL